MTDAQSHIDSYETADGFRWLHPETETDEWAASLDKANQTHDPRYGTRYEWPDGSAVIVSGDGWDYGVHRDRIAVVQALLDAAIKEADDDPLIDRPSGIDCPAQYHWCSGHSEALPAAESERYYLPAES